MESNENEFQAKLISLQEVYHLCRKLARRITDSPVSFDAVVTIARGGFPPARFLCDFLNIERLYSLQIKHYDRGAQQKEKARLINNVSGDIGSKNILLVDDVNDSGKSLSTAANNLGSSAVLKTAVMHEKDNTEFKADFVAERIHKWKWLIYPWAATEDVLEFLNKGNMLGADSASALDFLEKHYNLQIDKQRLENILKFKTNYFDKH